MCQTLNTGVCSKCSCGALKSTGESMTRLPGDWLCPACHVNNFAARKVCFKCRYDKTDGIEKISQEEQEKMMALREAHYKEMEEKIKREEEKKKRRWRSGCGLNIRSILMPKNSKMFHFIL